MKNLLLNYIEKAVNTYLQQDEQSAARLAKMTGKTICIELLPWQMPFYCRFTADRMVISLQEETVQITKLTGTPMQLGAAMLIKENRQQFFADDLQIEGDAEFAQQVTDLFDHLSIDWEEQAARLVGDVPAHQLSRLTGSLRKWLQKAGKSVTEDISDYLHEEAAWFPVRAELQEFFSDIDNLRMDADRLEARLNHLKSLLNKEEAQ